MKEFYNKHKELLTATFGVATITGLFLKPMDGFSLVGNIQLILIFIFTILLIFLSIVIVDYIESNVDFNLVKNSSLNTGITKIIHWGTVSFLGLLIWSLFDFIRVNFEGEVLNLKWVMQLIIIALVIHLYVRQIRKIVQGEIINENNKVLAFIRETLYSIFLLVLIFIVSKIFTLEGENLYDEISNYILDFICDWKIIVSILFFVFIHAYYFFIAEPIKNDGNIDNNKKAP